MDVVQVAVGVILNEIREILIARRAPDSHQGGLWEFPGGKFEPGETLDQALFRELKEELGIETRKTSPLLQVSHDYGDKAVFLDVCVVWDFEGQARGMEGQALQWVAVGDLINYQFPAANEPILAAVNSLLSS